MADRRRPGRGGLPHPLRQGVFRGHGPTSAHGGVDVAGIMRAAPLERAFREAESALRQLSWSGDRDIKIRAHCALRLLHNVAPEHAFEALRVDYQAWMDEVNDDVREELRGKFVTMEPQIIEIEAGRQVIKDLAKIPHPVPTWEIRRPLDSNPTVV